jgi:hypothetical protein
MSPNKSVFLQVDFLSNKKLTSIVPEVAILFSAEETEAQLG